jgi:hypothetical protein
VRKIHWQITLAAGLPVLFGLAVSWRESRELQGVRTELTSVTRANEFLKKTLGEMTIAITAKDKEIDRLRSSACQNQENTGPATPTISRRLRISLPSGASAVRPARSPAM